MDKRLLLSLGLSEGEARLYAEVAKAREISPSALAKEAGMKRTTAYSAARVLVEKGLLVEDTTKRPRVFRLAVADELALAISAEQKRSEDRQMLLKQLADEVSVTSAEKSYPVPKIRFVEEKNIGAFFRQETGKWNASMMETDATWWGFQDHTFVDHFSDWIRWYWERAPKGADTKLLTNLSSSERSMQGKFEHRHMKYWGEATNFISTVWAVGDYVIMLNTRQHPFYLVEIHDKLMAHDQREVFRNLWPLVP